MFSENLNAIFLIAAAPAVGSFVATASVRLPQGQNPCAGRSACTQCGHTLKIRDLLPIFSWLYLCGRCRYCHERLDVIYPIMETAAIAIALWAVLSTSGPVTWVTCGLGWALLALGAIDWRHFLLPNVLTYSLMGAGILAIQFVDPASLELHVAGLFVGFTAFAAIAWLYRSLRGREGLGMGDAKLAAAAGAWTSWTGLPGVVLWACLSALVALSVQAANGRTLSAQTPIAFGSHLCVGIWLVWLYGPLEIGLG